MDTPLSDPELLSVLAESANSFWKTFVANPTAESYENVPKQLQDVVTRTEVKIFFGDLRSELRALAYQIKQLYGQGSQPDDKYWAKIQKISKTLNRMICNSILDEILDKDRQDMNLVFIEHRDGQNDTQAKKYSNLERIKSYLKMGRNNGQNLSNNPSLLRSDCPTDKCLKLIKRLKTCNSLIKNALPGDIQNNGVLKTRFFDSERFRRIRERALHLHTLLHKTWPCSCDADHNETLGECCKQAKLRLGPLWSQVNSSLEFDVLLLGEEILQECRICLDARELNEQKDMRACLVRSYCQDIRLDLAVDSNGVLWERAPGLSRSLYTPGAMSPEEITLRDLIEQGVEFTLKEKRILAVILANSLLHLYESPWLSPIWGKENISFFYDYQTGSGFANFRRPYISTMFGNQNPCGEDPRKSRNRLHPHPNLLSLGIVLLEIELSEHIADISRTTEFQSYLQKPNVNTPELIARHLFKEYEKRARPTDTKPIEKCLDHNAFKASKTPFDDVAFVKAVYDTIVYPLEQDLLAGWGESSMTTEKLESILLEQPTNPVLDVGLSNDHHILDKYMGHFAHQAVRSQFSINAPVKIQENFMSTSHATLMPMFEIPAACCLIDAGSIMNISETSIQGASVWFRDLQNAHALLESARKYPLTKNDKANMVKIAILDTGIDLTHPAFRPYVENGQVPEWMDFVDGGAGIVDCVGHGTHTSHLLLKTAPFAKIFPCRVFKTTVAENNTASLVAKAIYHAVQEWGVDIISMSFAFPDEEEEIQTAIEYATTNVTNRALIFAAASNNRANEQNPIGYPARVKENTICVNSSTGQDKKSDFSPHGHVGRENFSTIGEGLEAAWPLNLNNNQEQRCQSGTSCATPLAAGTAALVLEYSRQKSFPKIRNAERLKRLQGIKKVLFECMTERNRDHRYNYIRPWLLLTGDPIHISSRITAALANMHG